MRTKVALLLTFSRQFSPALLLVNLACCQLFFLYGNSVLRALFFFKIAANATVFYLVRKLRPTTLFYYRNLGLTAVRLWMVSFVVDALLLVLFLLFTFNLR